MPEGPSIVILKEQVLPFKGKKIIEATGNAKVDKDQLVHRTVTDVLSWGKHFLIRLPNCTIRIHFLLFGSYSINEPAPNKKSPRLVLRFSNGALYFYSCSIRLLEGNPDDHYDWSGDVMNEGWDPRKARKKLLEGPDRLVCDAMLDQDIFAGVGNIIKNEVAFRIRVHPATRIGDLPSRKLGEMIREARTYSFQFLEWKKAFELKKHWLAHTKQICPRCDLPFLKEYMGKTHRRTFFCDNCQLFYQDGVGKRLHRASTADGSKTAAAAAKPAAGGKQGRKAAAKTAGRKQGRKAAAKAPAGRKQGRKAAARAAAGRKQTSGKKVGGKRSDAAGAGKKVGAERGEKKAAPISDR